MRYCNSRKEKMQFQDKNSHYRCKTWNTQLIVKNDGRKISIMKGNKDMGQEIMIQLKIITVFLEWEGIGKGERSSYNN